MPGTWQVAVLMVLEECLEVFYFFLSPTNRKDGSSVSLSAAWSLKQATDDREEEEKEGPKKEN